MPDTTVISTDAPVSINKTLADFDQIAAHVAHECGIEGCDTNSELAAVLVDLVKQSHVNRRLHRRILNNPKIVVSIFLFEAAFFAFHLFEAWSLVTGHGGH